MSQKGLAVPAPASKRSARQRKSCESCWFHKYSCGFLRPSSILTVGAESSAAARLTERSRGQNTGRLTVDAWLYTHWSSRAEADKMSFLPERHASLRGQMSDLPWRSWLAIRCKARQTVAPPRCLRTRCLADLLLIPVSLRLPTRARDANGLSPGSRPAAIPNI